MALPSVSDDVSTTTTQTTTQQTEEDPFEGHMDLFDQYLELVDAERAAKKMCLSHLFDSPEGVTNSQIEAKADESPLAKRYVTYKTAKKETKEEIDALRDSDDLPKQAGLRKYRELHGPQFEVAEELTMENAEENGLKPGAWRDNEDPIFMSEDFDLPLDDEGRLRVWYETVEDGDVVLENILKIAGETEGIGEKTLEKFKANLEKAGY